VLTRYFKYTFKMRPGYLGSPRPVHWRIWMDHNQDDDFNDSLELLIDTVATGDMICDPVRIPLLAQVGFTTLRFQMKRFDSIPPSACDTFMYGEVEDYRVRVKKHPLEKTGEPGLHVGELQLDMYPNPASGQVKLHFQSPFDREAGYALKVFDFTGRVCHAAQLATEDGTGRYQLDARNWPNGIYQIVVTGDAGRLSEKLIIAR